MRNILPKRWQRRIIKSVPRRRHLKGGYLHRIFGDRIFRAEFWSFKDPYVAYGLALGLFFGCTPTMGVQVIFCGLAAFFFRFNIPVALLATLISNPFTAPFLYTLEYKLGVALIGLPDAEAVENIADVLGSLSRHAKPLWVGSLVASVVCSALGYVVAKCVVWLNRVYHARADRALATTGEPT